ncbi:MAG: hypothetical protein ACLFSU_00285 [Acholeplasmataceae bacterium]
MTVIDWLLKSNTSLKYLVQRDLLGIPEEELRKRRELILKRGFGLVLMKKQDPDTYMWEGIYSPKYVSTHYTLWQLSQLGAPMDDERIEKAILLVLDRMWKPNGLIEPDRYQDLGIVAMMLRLAVEAELSDPRIRDMTDYILAHRLDDGGWHCDRQQPKGSSRHTTLSVIEALSRVLGAGVLEPKEEIERAILSGIEFILRERLFHSERDVLNFDFPYGWRYDMLRALEAMADYGFPLDVRMEEGLDLLVGRLDYYGRIRSDRRPKGRQHQRYTRTNRFCPFNTHRVLKVLKRYDPDRYRSYTKRRIDKAVL